MDNNLEKELEKAIRPILINSVSEGYKAAWQEIIKRINKGETKQTIKGYAEWVLANSNEIEKVAVDINKNNKIKID